MICRAFKKKNVKAFSLIEVLCAIVLLALVATPILQIIFASLSVNAKSRKMLAATDLASDTIGFICTNSFEDYSTSQKGLVSYYYGGDTPRVDGLEMFYDKVVISVSPEKYTGKVAIYNKYDTLTTDIPYGEVNQDSLYDYSYTDFTGSYTGRKLELKNVSYSGYKFDVDVYVVMNNSYSGKMYYSYDCFVEVFEPATYDSEGNVETAAKSMIKLSTSVPNTFKSKN